MIDNPKDMPRVVALALYSRATNNVPSWDTLTDAERAEWVTRGEAGWEPEHWIGPSIDAL